MHISKISIKNFRSIEQIDLTPDKFNILVGQNNHGKTNIFEAIKFFFNGIGAKEEVKDLRRARLDINRMSVEIEFSNAPAGIAAMRDEKKKAVMEKVLDGFDVISIKRSCADPKKRTLIVNGSEIPNPTGIDPALNDFLPKFEYVTTKTHLDDVSKYGKTTPIGNMLSGVIAVLLEGNPRYIEFRQKFEALFQAEDSEVKAQLSDVSGRVQVYLQKQFPDCKGVVFEIIEPAIEDLLKNFNTAVDDGVVTSAAEKGDGMQRALMLAIIRAYADFRKERDDIGKSFLFFIDEAELHLHPTAQRQLKNALLEISGAGDQVFITTHSSVLMVDSHANQNLFKVEKNQAGITSSVSITEEIDKHAILFELLGGSPNDLLLPRNFLIPEGRSEFEFLRRVIKRFYPSLGRGIQILFAEGDMGSQIRTLDALNRVFIPLYVENSIYKDKIIVLCDQPRNTQQLDNFKSSYPLLESNGQLFIQPFGSLEECYPDPWRKTPEEVATMSSRGKTDLAAIVGDSISQVQFEQEMVVTYQALMAAISKAYD